MVNLLYILRLRAILKALGKRSASACRRRVFATITTERESNPVIDDRKPSASCRDTTGRGPKPI